MKANTNIKNGQQLWIELKKDSTLSYTMLLRGLIRRIGYERGIGGKALCTIAGSSQAIRMNERVVYAVREAAKLGDGITLDITDPNMKADTLLASILSSYVETDIWTNATLVSDSDVENFIPSISIEFGELQDVINNIEEQTGAEFYFDQITQRAQLRHKFQPFTSGRGFILTDTQSTDDNADYTAYISPNSPPNYVESKYKTDGYSSQVYSILSPENRPSKMEDLGFTSEVNFGTISSTREYACKFKPKANKIFPGDVYVVGAQWNTSGGGSPPTVRFRICKDNGSGTAPLNVGGVVFNVYFRPQNWTDPQSTSATDNYHLANSQYFVSNGGISLGSLTGFRLDVTKDYWLICVTPALSTNRFNWGLNSNVSTANNAVTHTANFSTTSDGGSSWTSVSNLPCFAVGRYRSIAFRTHDPKAIAATGSGMTTSGGTVIESTLSNSPSTVKTEQALFKYHMNQLYDMARPRVQWSTMVITPPNTPIFPNDPLMIVDSTLSFSTTGQQVMTATAGDMVYEFGQRGGEGNVYSSNLSLSITPIGSATHY